jgi:hypothetical protein
MCGLTKVLTLSWLLSVKLPTAVYGGKRDGVSTVQQLEANEVKEERSGKRISTYLFKACSAFAFIIHILQIDIEHVNNGFERCIQCSRNKWLINEVNTHNSAQR